MRTEKPTDILQCQILWDRLIAIVEEQALTLQRTAFSTIVRESGDLAAGFFDAKGRMLAQAVTGTPGHINSMALAVGHVLSAFPADQMEPGDVYLHNDPWLGTGHTNDFSVTTPFFKNGVLVGLFACNSHIMDIGGLPNLTGSTDVFMEGLYLPIIRLARKGVLDENVMAIIRANTRLPIETEGDVHSLIAANLVGSTRLLEAMDEFEISDVEQVATYIISTSENAFLDVIRSLPKGSWTSEAYLDGFENTIKLIAELTISNHEMRVDYKGSSGSIKQNINVPLCYTAAYTSYAIGCILATGIPNNHGSLAPRKIAAPLGSILNARKPAAVAARHIVGLMIPDLVFGCLRQVVPERVPAEGAGVLWSISASGEWASLSQGSESFLVNVVTTGGMGALPHRDGQSATGFPSGVRNGPIEIFEAMSTLVCWKKEYRQDSGGAGQYRGGLGQHIEISNLLHEPFSFVAAYERMIYPARGVQGGKDGMPGTLGLDDGRALTGKGRFEIPAGARVIVRSPGGGGFGEPKLRDRDLIDADILDEKVSRDVAEKLYRLDVAARAPAS